MSSSRRQALAALAGAAFASRVSSAQVAPAPVESFSFYVDSTSGKDSNDGRTPQTPKQTLAAIAALPVQPGQSVGLKRGSVWRETLVWSRSATISAPISIGAYGDGASPVISGAGLRNWTLYSQPAGVASTLFQSGFETVGLTDWANVTQYGRTVVRRSLVSPQAGSACLEIVGDGSDNRGWTVGAISAMQIGRSYRFRLNVRTPSGSLKGGSELRCLRVIAPANRCFYLSLFTDSKGNISSATLNGDGPNCGNLVFQNVSLGGAFKMDSWNTVEVVWKVDSTSGGGEATVNGKKIGAKYAQNTTGCAGASQACVGNDAFGSVIRSGASVFYDSVVIEDASGSPSAGPTIWTASQITAPSHVVYADRLGKQIGSLSALSADGDWFWDASSGRLFLAALSNPSQLCEIPERKNAIVMNGASFVTLRGVRWRSAASEGLRVQGVSNGIRIESCTGELCFAEGAFVDVYLSSSTAGKVMKSEVRNNGASGLRINGNFSDWLVQDSSFHHNGLVNSNATSAHTWTAGLKLWGDSRFGQGTLVERCSVYANGCGSPDQAKGVGLWIDQAAGVTVRSNTVHTNDAWGLYLEKTQSCNAYCNTIYSCARTAQWCAGLGVKASESENSAHNGVYHNIVFDSGCWGLYCGAWQGMGACRFDNNTIANNIIFKSRRELFYAESGGANNGTGGLGNIYSNNCFGPEYPGFALWNGKALSSYTEWQTAYGAPMSNVNSDPQFSQAATGDFRLLSSSPCRSAALTMALVPYLSSLQPDLGPVPLRS